MVKMESFAVKMESFASLKTWQAARNLAREADTARAYLDQAHVEAIHEDKIRSSFVHKVNQLVGQGAKGWR